MLESGHEGISTAAGKTGEPKLPYCLTKGYQLLVAAIGQSNAENKHNKRTGIYCPYEQND